MMHPHAQILTEKERGLLVDGIDVAIASLDRFERPPNPRSRWTATGRLVSQAMARSILRSRGGILDTRFVGTREGLRVEIVGSDSGTSLPLLTIEESTPLDRNPTFCDADEIEATMRRWHRIVANSTRLDMDRIEDTGVLLGSMAVAAGGDPSIMHDLSVQLPSRYAPGLHHATPEAIERHGTDAYLPVERMLTGDGRERLLEGCWTSAITSRWWNYGSRTRQQRVLIDLSGIMTAKLKPPGAMEIMRRLAA